jgi:hypothetical protein
MDKLTYLISHCEEDTRKSANIQNMFGALDSWSCLGEHILLNGLDSPEEMKAWALSLRKKFEHNHTCLAVWGCWPSQMIPKLIKHEDSKGALHWKELFDWVETTTGREGFDWWIEGSHHAKHALWWFHENSIRFLETGFFDTLKTHCEDRPLALAGLSFMEMNGVKVKSPEWARTMEAFLRERVDLGLEKKLFKNLSSRLPLDLLWEDVFEAFEAKPDDVWDIPVNTMRDFLKTEHGQARWEKMLKNPTVATKLKKNKKFEALKPFWPTQKRQVWENLLDSSLLKKGVEEVVGKQKQVKRRAL